jgi:hypothetical protein
MASPVPLFRPCWGEVLFFASALAFFPPWLGGLLSLVCPRESNQREGHPDGLPATRVPCAPRPFARAPNSRLQTAQSLRQEARFIAKGLRCSAAPTGPGCTIRFYVGAACNREQTYCCSFVANAPGLSFSASASLLGCCCG